MAAAAATQAAMAAIIDQFTGFINLLCVDMYIMPASEFYFAYNIQYVKPNAEENMQNKETEKTALWDERLKKELVETIKNHVQSYIDAHQLSSNFPDKFEQKIEFDLQRWLKAYQQGNLSKDELFRLTSTLADRIDMEMLLYAGQQEIKNIKQTIKDALIFVIDLIIKIFL